MSVGQDAAKAKNLWISENEYAFPQNNKANSETSESQKNLIVPDWWEAISSHVVI